MSSCGDNTCSCGDNTWSIKNKPNAIAYCHCSICKKLNVGHFIETTLHDITFLKSNRDYVRKSNRASRYYCRNCNDYIFMHYDDSVKLWINVNTKNYENIEIYDIYK